MVLFMVGASIEAVPGQQRSPGMHVNSYLILQGQLREQGLLNRRHAYYWAWIIALIASFAGVWCAVVLLGDSWFQLFLAAALAVVTTQFGFLGHDAAHRQIFASRRWNEWTARILSGGLAGLAYGWWMAKHSKHHAVPNQPGKDPDIAPGALVFTAEEAKGKRGLAARVVQHQGWLFFPMLLLEGLNLHIQSVRAVLNRKAPIQHRWAEGALVGVRHAGILVALFLLLPPGKAVAFIAVQLGLFGLMLGASFAPGHKGMPIIPATMKLDFLRRQILVSRNIRGGVLTDFAMGGLNYQIEHHLFPSMPRPNLRRAQPLVRAYCAELGLPYTETGLFRSYAIVVRHLNRVGVAGSDTFQCPLTTAYRT